MFLPKSSYTVVMMSILLYEVLAYVMPVNAQLDRKVPNGSYLRTCRPGYDPAGGTGDPYLEGDTLYAACKTRRRVYRWSVLKNVSTCIGDIANIDGELTCSKAFVQEYCVSVDSRKGWQRFDLPHSFTKITSISGGWSVDTRKYSLVGSSGHLGQDAISLAPYNQYKYDQRFPFGALLMGSGQGTLWIKSSNSFSSAPFSAVDMRINDANNALSDNRGSLRVCFGS